MFMTLVWIASIIAAVYLADLKKRGVGSFFFLSIITGPLAVIILLMLPAKNADRADDVSGAFTLQEARRRLGDIQFSLCALQEKTKNLESLIARLSKADANVPVANDKVVEPVVSHAAQLESVRVHEEGGPAKRSDMELDFGRNWLNKIGVVVLALGVAFLISYSFKYFGPFLKIVFGYAVGGALFFAGLRLEAKEKFMKYGRVLLGGAWAIVYFTTYAMHHFEASRVIADQGVDIFLLVLVVAGMMTHVLKYRSEGMMSVVLFVAYVTSTIGSITVFTVISLLFLAVFALFLVYKFQWVKTLSLGVLLTYGIHLVWVLPNLFSSAKAGVPFGMAAANYHEFMNFIFLSCYWLVFLAGTHLVRAIKDPVLSRALAATNFGNIAIYSVLSYPLVLELFYAQRFLMVFIAGLVYLVCALFMKKLGRQKMYVSDMVAAVFAVTFALSLKFLPTSTLLVWMVEIPFLLFIGTNFKERIFRHFSYALSLIVAARLFFLGLEHMSDVRFLGLVWTWYGFMCFWASISMAACFYLTRRMEKDTEASNFDILFDHIFSFAASAYLSLWIWSFVRQPWIAFAFSVQALAFLGLSLVWGLRRFRAYAYLAMISGAAAFLFETVSVGDDFMKWFIVSCDVLAMFGFYYAIKLMRQRKLSELFFEYEAELSFVAGIILLVTAIHQYASPQWISLSLGLSSVAVILIGFFDGNKTERMGGMALLALTLGRVVLIDLSGLDIIFKIITLIVLGILFLGVSYIYNRFNIGKRGDAS